MLGSRVWEPDALRVAVDVGGSFVDVLAVTPSNGVFWKKLPRRGAGIAATVSRAVAEVVRDAGRAAANRTTLIHSTTLATNALVEGRFGRAGLIVTQGFRELLGARLSARGPDQGSVNRAPAPIVPLEFVSEVTERMAADGSVVVELDETSVRAAGEFFKTRGISTVAVALLHSYANPAHELRIKQLLHDEIGGFQVFISSEAAKRPAELHRSAATCANAVLARAMSDYIGEVSSALHPFGMPMLVMQAGGGLTNAETAIEKPVDTAGSGPAASALAAVWIGRQTGSRDLIAFDMGGTSTDLCCIQAGKLSNVAMRSIGNVPMFSDSLDVASIGAGGGSIASWSPEGRLNVGPRSAGAYPGPACYGQGGIEATVTDAHLILGRLSTRLLEGALFLDQSAARRAIEELARERGRNKRDLACGIVELASRRICAEIRRLLALQGREAGDFTLMAAGGAGPLHAAHVADLAGMPRVLIPPKPGLAGALGLHAANFDSRAMQGIAQPVRSLELGLLQKIAGELEARATSALERERVPRERWRISRVASFRYSGFIEELTVDLQPGILTSTVLERAIAEFHQKFRERCGHSRESDREVELVTLRVSAEDIPPGPRRLTACTSVGPARIHEWRDVHFVEVDTTSRSPVYKREELEPRTRITGPAILEQPDCTTVVPPGWSVWIHETGTAVMQRGAADTFLSGAACGTTKS